MLDFIPIALRKKLEADAAQAQKNGDRNCAGILLQLAAYADNDAPQFARDLGAEACTARYDSARELMNLVVQAEAERAKKPRK